MVRNYVLTIWSEYAIANYHLLVVANYHLLVVANYHLLINIIARRNNYDNISGTVRWLWT